MHPMLQQFFDQISRLVSDPAPQQINANRVLILNDQKAAKIAKRGVVFHPPLGSIKSKPINIYNQGIPADWMIEADKLQRNTFQVFSTGDPFSTVSPKIEIRGAHINIHVGLKHEQFSPLILIQEALQLCRTTHEHGARSVTIALPEQFHPLLNSSDFNTLVISDFKASGATRLYFYDEQYLGKIDDELLKSSMQITFADTEDKGKYIVNKSKLARYLLNHTASSNLNLDQQVMHHTRLHQFTDYWMKLNIDKTSPAALLHLNDNEQLIIPPFKIQPHIILCCSANKPLAEEIAASLRLRGELVRLYSIKGQGSEAKIPNFIELCGTTVTIVQSTRPNPDHNAKLSDYKNNGASAYFFETQVIAREAKLRGAEKVNLINPYQFNARSDKAEDNHKGKTGAYVQQNGLILKAAEIDHVITAECHDNHTMSGTYTSNNIRGSSVAALSVIAIKIAKEWLAHKEQHQRGKLRSVTPDAGAAKRTQELTLQLQNILGDWMSKNRVLGDKQRDSHKDDSAQITHMDSGDESINELDTYLITDDETTTGTTLLLAIKNLTQKGAKNIKVIVVHNNLPLNWLERQLYLARFLFLGVAELHFSNTQEMGTLAQNFDHLVNTWSHMSGLSQAVVKESIYSWFKEKIGENHNFNEFQNLFSQLRQRIRVHSLAQEFAHQVATMPYMTNPYAFNYKVNEYIQKITTKQAQAIAVFEGVSVAAASAAALALRLPLHIIPEIHNQKYAIPNGCFALIGTAADHVISGLKQDLGLDIYDLRHKQDADGDFVIIYNNNKNASHSETSPNIYNLMTQVEQQYFNLKANKQFATNPVKLLGIGMEGQMLAGQISYLLAQSGVHVGICAVERNPTQPSTLGVFIGQEGEELLCADKNSLDMGDVCIPIASVITPELQQAISKLANDAKIYCPERNAIAVKAPTPRLSIFASGSQISEGPPSREFMLD